MPKKLNNNKSGALAALRALRREKAEARQAKRDARSAGQQIALIKSRRGESKRELARLTDPSPRILN